MSGLSEKQIICEKSDYSKPESALSSRTVHISNNTFLELRVAPNLTFIRLNRSF